MSQTLESINPLLQQSNNHDGDDIAYLLDNGNFITLETALEVLARGSFEAKWVISKVLVKYGEKIIPILRDVILDESADLEYRSSALRIVGQINSPQVILMVSELFALTQEEELINLAIETLASGGKESIAFLSSLLKEEEYRLLAVKALGQIPHSDIIPPLLSVVKDENSDVRVVALSALKNFDRTSILKVIIEALQDIDSRVRKEALVGIGLKLKKNQAIPIISMVSPLLNDLNLTVAQQAALTLSKSNHPFAVESLEKTLNSPYTPTPLKITIIKSLAWIETEKSIQSLAKYLLTANDLLTIEIIKVLGRITKPQLKPIVIEVLNNFYQNLSGSRNDPEILQTLCYSWYQLKAKTALKFLQEIAQNLDKFTDNYQKEKLKSHLKLALENIKTYDIVC